MNKIKETLVGFVVSLTGNNVTVRLLNESFTSTLPIVEGMVHRVGQVGSFLKIPLGYASLYGIVTKIGADAIPEPIINKLSANEFESLSTRWMTLALIGEKTSRKFERGITQFPTPQDEVHLVTPDDLNIIYGSYDNDNSIKVGHISVSESLPAKIEIDKLITRHCAIVGSTGSGKSNTVAVILEAIAKGDFPSSRMLIIDPHGEYNDSLKSFSKVFKIDADSLKLENELYVPFWALPFQELLSTFPGKLNDQNEDYLRSKIFEKKLLSIEIFNKSEANKDFKINKESINEDSPIPFSIKDLWFELDDFERQTFKENRKPETVTDKTLSGDAEKLISNEYPPPSLGSGAPFINNLSKGILGYLNGMRSRMLDQKYKFLYEPGDCKPNNSEIATKDLDILVHSWLGHEKAITILDLSEVPTEIMTSISGAVLKIVYDALFWGQNLSVGGRQQPLLIVLEEAHSYLKAGENSIASRTVQTIAKEGRKYGVGLLLATQRPTELDETVLSQCGTIIALRMTNSGDRAKVAVAVQDELSNMIALLPALRTGEGLIMGEAVKIPSRVQFDKISFSPSSSDPKVSEQWKLPKPDTSKYRKIIFNWRNQKLK